jgi:CRP-like cAMP-binding protein
MTIKDLSGIVKKRPFFSDFSQEQINLLTGCTKNERFAENTFLARAGTPSNTFYAIRSGRIAVEIAVPGHDKLVIQTLGENDVFGWSWIFPPYRWVFDGRSQTPVHVLAFDGTCLRNKCDANTDLGYCFMKKFAELMTRRLEATRLQLMDIYGNSAPLKRALDEPKP